MRKRRWHFFIGLMVLTFLPWTQAQAKDQWFDLSYPFDAKTIYWPTEKGFKRETIFYGDTPKGYFYSAYKFCAPEHGGTHIDAPRHFSAKGHTVDEIPLDQLMGSALVIDVRNKTNNNPDYAITVGDIQRFEQKYRRITDQDIVLFRTGWEQYWNNKKKYLGSAKLGDVNHLHFPGLSKEAAQYLVKRQIKGIGIDTASMDPGNSKEFWTHRILLAANVFGLENLSNLQDLPAIGTQLIIAPMKIKGGSGAPSRVFALVKA